jgi:predicted nucleotidyltransferase
MTDTGRTTAQQNHLQRTLSRYINGCTVSRSARLLALFAPWLAYRVHAAGISRAFADFRQALAFGTPAPALQISVQPYSGTNAGVRRIMQAIAPLADTLCGAYVHGSLATGEEIPYSDFDGLVILRDAVVASPSSVARTAAALNRLRLIMFEIDPLQHHGWLVLTESDLRFYCEAVFPVALFGHARSLLPDHGLALRLAPRDSTEDYRVVFDEAISNVLRRTSAGHRPRDQFALKSLLSQVMLLPALYIQARYGMTVYKKVSFDQARRDFAPDLWDVMDRISVIRQDWRVHLAGPADFALRRVLAARRVATRWLAPPVPATLAVSLTPDFWAAVARLAVTMRDLVQTSRRNSVA